MKKIKETPCKNCITLSICKAKMKMIRKIPTEELTPHGCIFYLELD